MAQIEIKRVTLQMLSDIADIERECFSSPWSESGLEMLLGDSAVGFAAFCEERLVGYVGMMTVLDEGQITNVAVRGDFRRKGCAKALLCALEEYARENGIVFLSLEVRRSNEAARGLYLADGWRDAGVRRNFYSLPTEDAIVMTKTLEK